MVNIDQAKLEADTLSNDLAGVVGSLTKKMTGELDTLIAKLSSGIDTLTNNELRDIMARISVEAYYIGIAKEQTSLKDACAEALYKEGLAKSYSLTQGAVEAKKQQAVLDTIDKQAVSILYSTVASLLKTKLDEAHRIVSAVNGVLISRASDAKQFYNPRSEQDQLTVEQTKIGE